LSSTAASTLRYRRVASITCQRCGVELDLSSVKPLSTTDCPACGTTAMAPARVDHFLLVKMVGRGGAGAVFQAFDENLHRQVAIKLIERSLQDGKSRYDDCIREARASAMLNHPNIVQIHSLSEDRGQPYLVMEFLSGGSLSQRLREGRLPEREAVRVAMHVARGLAAAHRFKIVHGDIKPQNILFDHHRDAKLIDFGLASRSRCEQLELASRGTPRYVAPEVVRGGRPGPLSDLYNLGVTLYLTATGRDPFPASSARERALMRLSMDPAPATDHCPGLSPATVAAVDRLLQREPDDRYQSAEEVAHVLEQVLARLQPALAA